MQTPGGNIYYTLDGSDPRQPIAAGERIVLRDAAGRIIHDFRFDDGSYAATDGRGLSLVVRDLSKADPGALSDGNTWRPSLNDGGSPASHDGVPYP
jgi:hypothetical protein